MSSFGSKGDDHLIALVELVSHLDDLLGVAQFNDYCPNGLQIEGRQEVHSLITGVTASAALIEAAIAKKADAILVHHGYFWRGENPCITGMKRARVRALLAQDISLLAYHLPLDAHPECGNNVKLAAALGFQIRGSLAFDGDATKGLYGTLDRPMSAQALQRHIAQVLDREPLLIAGGPETISTIGWCTGAAQAFIDQAIARGLDAFLSGEISEPTVHAARECGLHYFSAGHHATERYGVQALGEHLQARFGLQVEFVDLDNPV